MKHNKTLSAFVYLAWFVGLSIFIGCGDPEDTESTASIVIPSELYDTSQLAYDISDAEVQELMALDVPTNWSQTEDSELRAKYYHAQLLKQFGNIPAVHIVAARERKKQKYWKVMSYLHLMKRLTLTRHNIFSGPTSAIVTNLKGR